MNRSKRVLALIACIGMVLVLFTSFVYIVHEADHACVGRHCEVCRHIEEVRALLHSFGLLVLTVLLVRAALTLRRALCAPDGLRVSLRCTLVSWKVRLNN
ncbi:MAG: hypothetical protein IKQ45_03215 [Clostridia bacterium]|nr:hypothetical protein [Clostridia bacterium]